MGVYPVCYDDGTRHLRGDREREMERETTGYEVWECTPSAAMITHASTHVSTHSSGCGDVPRRQR